MARVLGLPMRWTVTARASRLMARARWAEYRRMLQDAVAAGYSVVGVQEWVLGGGPSIGPVLAIRHDVDDHPRSALVMAEIEAELGFSTTWYLRWRTANPEVARALRAAGASVGLHYETLSRLVMSAGVTEAKDVESLLPEAREQLRKEITAFQAIHGPIRSVCAHGDTRVPFVRNVLVMADQDPKPFGVDFEAYEAMKGRGLAYWLTDRLRADGGWVDHTRPADLFRRRVSPILAVVHPNAWASGRGLAIDRLISRALPADPAQSSRPRLIRTGRDAPPPQATNAVAQPGHPSLDPGAKR